MKIDQNRFRFLKRIVSLALAVLLGVSCCAVTALAALPGDADGDGQVTPADARLALRASVGLETLQDRAAADVDGDGRVSSSDARIILRVAVGLDRIENGRVIENGQQPAADPAGPKIDAWLRKNGAAVSGGSYYYREEDGDMAITLMSDPSHPNYPVSIGMTMTEGQHYSYQSIVMFNDTFTECVMQVVMKDGTVEVMRNLYDVNHRVFRYETRVSSLTLLESKGVKYYTDYVANAAPTMAYYSLRWFVLILQDFDMGVDPAADIHLDVLV